MKLPFFEHTVLGLDVRPDAIHWVELNRLGSRISLISKGFVEAGGVAGLRNELSDILESIESEAYQVAVACEELLVAIEVEDVPYFEEQEEVAEWVQGRVEEYRSGFEDPVEIKTHIVQVDEDQQRCIFQCVSSDEVDYLIRVLEEHEVYPSVISTGATEAGYGLIYEEDFVSDFAATLSGSQRSALCTYKNGLVHNILELEQGDEESLVEEANSYLRTEEVSYNLSEHSIPLWIESGALSQEGSRSGTRNVEPVVPLHSKLKKNELSPQYGVACGLAIKTWFPNLDGFNFSPKPIQKKGVEWKDKKESIRTGVLLFPPVIVILLLLFAVEGFLDVNLSETNQVLEQLSDKIERVNEKTEAVNTMTASYRQVKELVDERRNSARTFELISAEIPSSMWLENLGIQFTASNTYRVSIAGLALRESTIAEFMGELEDVVQIQAVELLSSRKISLSDRLGVNQLGQSQGNEFQLRMEVDY